MNVIIDINKRNEIIEKSNKIIHEKEHDRTITKNAAVSKIIEEMKEILKDAD